MHPALARSPIRSAPLLAAAALLVACSQGDAPPAPSGEASSATRPSDVVVWKMPDGTADGAAWVRERTAAAAAEGRPTLVYVGAAWCEPCQRLKDAAARGELDADLPGLALLELDHDRDEAALAAMGCTSRMIPLLAVPDAAGRCTDRRLEGAIKGEGAVRWMTPRVQALLR